MDTPANTLSSNPTRSSLRQIDRAVDAALRIDRILGKSSIRSALEVQWQAEPIYRAYEQAQFSIPLHEEYSLPTFYFSLKWQQEKMLSDLQRSLETFRRCFYLPGLPLPPCLRPLILEAREAWERYDEGDPEPLDYFVKERLGIKANHEGPLPEEVRQRVLNFLDACFASVPFYQPGDWFFLGPQEVNQLAGLLGDHITGFEDLKQALSGDSKPFRERLNEELPGATRVAWEDIQGVSTRTLLNEVSQSLRETKAISADMAELTQKKPYKLLENYTEPGKRYRSPKSGGVDSDLAQFEARETARQQIEALPRLVERASFTPSERTVYDFDSKVGTDFESVVEATQAAAQHLNIAPSTIRTYRERYRAKLQKAARA